MPARPPTRHLERDLLAAGHRLVAGMDEVGRGALAGPVSVGVVVVDESTGRLPRGLRDSKLLTAAAREALCEPVRRWCVGSAVGHASPAEIDALGIIAALRLAGTRALATLAAAGVEPDVLILDGTHDWLTPPQDLFAALDAPAAAVPLVRTQVKADLRCAVVAGASVLAKCERDAIMVELSPRHPEYGWAANKGYSAPEHLLALRDLGPTELHRRSWRLPQAAPDVVAAPEAVAGESAAHPVTGEGAAALVVESDALDGGAGLDDGTRELNGHVTVRAAARVGAEA
ncbi:ribonuclease HII [Georgenia faecalis]|uniref:Ribonuclease n=1 Tax=Georgenia faecalis TaxID=2483799 RepID=A0ABV9DDL6_9MICO|nr:ribonuclease HII [Georgenia faecalis]